MRFCVILVFCFHLSSSCDVGESYRFFSSFIFGQLTHRDTSCVCIPHSLISFAWCLLFLLLCVSSLCVASVVLALVFMPGLYSAAYRAASLAWPAEERFMWLPFVFFFCFCFCLCFLFCVDRDDDVLCWLLSCPFSSVCFPCFSPNVLPV